MHGEYNAYFSNANHQLAAHVQTNKIGRNWAQESNIENVGIVGEAWAEAATGTKCTLEPFIVGEVWRVERNGTTSMN